MDTCGFKTWSRGSGQALIRQTRTRWSAPAFIKSTWPRTHEGRDHARVFRRKWVGHVPVAPGSIGGTPPSPRPWIRRGRPPSPPPGSTGGAPPCAPGSAGGAPPSLHPWIRRGHPSLPAPLDLQGAPLPAPLDPQEGAPPVHCARNIISRVEPRNSLMEAAGSDSLSITIIRH